MESLAAESCRKIDWKTIIITPIIKTPFILGTSALYIESVATKLTSKRVDRECAHHVFDKTCPTRALHEVGLALGAKRLGGS